MTIDPVSLGITVALTGLNMALTASNRIEGPRLDDLSVSLGDYGSRLTMLWGKRRLDGCPIFFAEPLHEVERQSKTKGGKYNEYTYFGTWANVIAGHEIGGVTRIWWDKHLVYDATGVGPITPFPLAYTTMANKGKGTNTTTIPLGDHLRIYLGTETQEPDPRMLATVEAQHGEGTCPAYRGTAYVMFEEVPLEKVGNRLPQVAVEATSVVKPAYVWESIPTAIGNPNMWNTAFSPDGERLLWAGTTNFVLVDLPSRTIINQGKLPRPISLGNSIGMMADGSVLAVSNNHQDLIRFSPDLSSVVSVQPGIFPNILFDQHWQNEVWVRQAGNGVEHWMTVPWSIVPYWYHNGSPTETSAMPGGNWRPTGFFTDLDGNIWAVGASVAGGTTTAHFLRIVTLVSNGPSHVAVTGLSPSTGTLNATATAFHYRDDTHDHFVMEWRASSLHTVDRQSGAILAGQTGVALDVYNSAKQLANVRPGAATFWVNRYEVSAVDLSIVRVVNPFAWKPEDSDGILYVPAYNALAGWPQYSANMTLRYLDRITGGAVNLGDIASDVAQMVGVRDYDFSDLTQEIAGYSVTLGSGRDMLEPLFTVHDCDIAPHDFGVRGVVRGGTATATLLTRDFVRQDDNPRYVAVLKQDLPRALVASFADADNDQQTNTVRAARPMVATDAKGEQAIDLTTLVLSAKDAADLNDRALRRQWGGRRSFSLSLTAKELRLEPGDLRVLDLDGEKVTARLIRISPRADDVIATEWEYDHPTLHSLAGLDGPSFDGRREEAIVISAPARAAILDIPLARDGDETRVPFLYFAAGTTGGSFRGADIWMSDTLDFDDYVGGWGAVQAGHGMTWGVTSNALPAARPWLFDRGSRLNVRFPAGSPGGATEDELLADPTRNLIAVGNHADGWELIQFATAALETDGSWTLSTLLRGVRGTEHRIAGHGTGDMVVMLDGLGQRAMGASEIDDTDAYRAVATGRSLDGSLEEQVTFTAAAQKPFAPVHGRMMRETGTGDWAISATRRTRIGGGNVAGGDVPLGETGESWLAEILSGATVVRTLTGASLPLTYTAAQQTADFGAPQTSLSVRLYQVAPDLNLRGYPLAIAA